MCNTPPRTTPALDCGGPMMERASDGCSSQAPPLAPVLCLVALFCSEQRPISGSPRLRSAPAFVPCSHWRGP